MYSVLKYLFPRSDCIPPERSRQTESMTGGLPHSEIVGSKGIRPSPTLIAAYHVLHRLLSPRHSPNALIALDPIQKKTEIFVIPYELGGNYHFLRCSYEHRTSASKIGKLIYEPDCQHPCRRRRQSCSLISVKTYAAIIIRGQSSCAVSRTLGERYEGPHDPAVSL